MKMFFMCPLGGLMQKSIISIIAFLKDTKYMSWIENCLVEFIRNRELSRQVMYNEGCFSKSYF